MGFSCRVATAVQMGCSAAPCLVISVALGPARAVGVMSLMSSCFREVRRGPVSRAHETSSETSGTGGDASCGPSG